MIMVAGDPAIVRPADFTRPGELAFVRSAWWYATKRRDIRKILPTASVRVACLRDDRDVILGFTVDGFVYVSRAVRNMGIEDALRADD